MLYSDGELKKRIKAGCSVYYFYASDEALVRGAAAKVVKALEQDDPETTTLDGPAPTVEEIVLAAGTISFFGGRRLVLMPLLQPSKYSDKDLAELCDTLADTENAVFIITTVMEERYGKLSPGKREKKLLDTCEKLGYCAQLTKPGRSALQGLLKEWAAQSGASFAPGADKLLLDRCGEDQFLLQNEVEKLAALADYGTVTEEMVRQLGTVTLDADTFDMVRLVTAGRAGPAVQKLNTLLALQNDPILIAGALVANYIDLYRVVLAHRSRRPSGELAKDFGYNGYRLKRIEESAQRLHKSQLEESLRILQELDLDLKSSKLPEALLLQTAVCRLALAGRRP